MGTTRDHGAARSGDRPAARSAGARDGDAAPPTEASRTARTAAGPELAPASGRAAGGAAAQPPWLRTAGAASWRLLAIVAVVFAVLYLLSVLRVVVLPVIVALLATTLLRGPVEWLRARGVPDAGAVMLTMLGAFLILAGIVAAIAPSILGQTDELRTGVEDGIREIGGILEDPPFNLSAREIDERIDAGMASLRENSGPLTEGLRHGAILVGEVITGLILTVLLTFFFLKDGEAMWRWIVDFVRPRHSQTWNEVGGRVWVALGGYVRGIALVGLVDAILIGIALLIIGVPLVVPLMVLTFLGAFLPLIGAFLAGLAAVLIALVFNGPFAALLVLGAIVLVQQVEGHLLYPLLMGRTVHLHPAVIILALGVGGILAGIIGVFLAVPVAGVLAVLLQHARQEPPPDSPVMESPGAATA